MYTHRVAVGRDAVFYTIVPCALGFVLVAITSRGVHRVVLGDDPVVLEATLREALPAAAIVRDDAALGDISASVVALASGAALSHALPLDLRGTAFQQRVWRELQRIPRGETITYAELATRIGSPTAVRAVGTACGANPVAMAASMALPPLASTSRPAWLAMALAETTMPLGASTAARGARLAAGS